MKMRSQKNALNFKGFFSSTEIIKILRNSLGSKLKDYFTLGTFKYFFCAGKVRDFK